MFNAFQMFTKRINESKLFAGLIIILLNVGGKFIPVTLSKSAEDLVKSKLSRDIIVFAISWMGTRCIVVAFFLTCFFVLLSDFLLNYDSKFCCVPSYYREVKEEEDELTDEDINKAIAILEKSKKNKQIQQQHEMYVRYFKK